MRQTQLRTRAKICGITRTQDIDAVVQAGADAIGLVFFPPSPRHVSIEQAQILASSVPAYVQLVGLFVNASAEEIQTYTHLISKFSICTIRIITIPI
jgi:phosphoribosylanthranilate isomerase